MLPRPARFPPEVRVAFLGTPEDAARCLRALHDAGHDVALVVTQPDRRRGRGGAPGPSPVKAAAADLGLPVVTPERAAEVADELRSSGAELGVVVAFGQILPADLLAVLPHGFVNLHYSLLPRWRGAAPVERAVLAGDRETGVCLMRIDEGLDTGPVFASVRVTIGDDETAGELRSRLTAAGIQLLLERLDAIPHLEPTPQVGEPTYAHKLTVEEFRLDWTAPAEQLARVVRAGNPNPGAWAMAGEKRLKVWRARAAPGSGRPGTLLDGPAVATGSGILLLEEVQVEGRPVTRAADWARGYRGSDLS